MPTTATASIVLPRPGPRTATIAMASKIAGKASITSISRMMTESVEPPK